ncbi:HPr family phosphocarrier protein [Oscillospiraceae bacterium PP1C4]
MYSVKVVVTDEIGLHARPANKFVKKAASFSSEIKVNIDGFDTSYNAKSITAVLRMAAVKDTQLVITAIGEDEAQACEALKALVSSNFES